MKQHIPIEISPSFFLYLAAIVLMLPLPWATSVLLAGAIHELGHLMALKLQQIPVASLRLKIGGANILALFSTQRQELICAAAGPLAGVLIGTLFPVFPRLALCAIVQTAFNLLPLIPFDGGRVVRAIAVCTLGYSRGMRVFAILECAVFVCLILCGFILYKSSVLLATVVAITVLRCIKIRRPHLDISQLRDRIAIVKKRRI